MPFDLRGARSAISLVVLFVAGWGAIARAAGVDQVGRPVVHRTTVRPDGLVGRSGGIVAARNCSSEEMPCLENTRN
jgi:hypothetical protein